MADKCQEENNTKFAAVFHRVTIQDVQPNRPQTRALHALSLHSQLLSEANGRSAHYEIKNSSYCKQVCIVWFFISLMFWTVALNFKFSRTKQWLYRISMECQLYFCKKYTQFLLTKRGLYGKINKSTEKTEFLCPFFTEPEAGGQQYV